MSRLLNNQSAPSVLTCEMVNKRGSWERTGLVALLSTLNAIALIGDISETVYTPVYVYIF